MSGVFLAGGSPSSRLSRQIISRYFGEPAELPAGARAHVGGKKLWDKSVSAGVQFQACRPAAAR